MRVTTWNMHRAVDSGDSDAGWSALDHIFVSDEIVFDASSATLVREDELSEHAHLHVDLDESQWS